MVHIGTLRIVESMRRHHSPLIVVIGWCVGRGAYDGSVRTRPVVVVIVTYSTAAPDGILRCRDAAADFTIAFRCRVTNLVAGLPAGHHISVISVDNPRAFLRCAVSRLLRQARSHSVLHHCGSNRKLAVM